MSYIPGSLQPELSSSSITISCITEKENLPRKTDPKQDETSSGIFKYGETLESFFHWHQHISDMEYQNWCRTVLDGTATLEQQAAAWRRLLERRKGDTAASDLLRWHRRATSYFTSRLQEMKDDAPLRSHLFRTDWLHIWLTYAKMQAPTNHNAARQTLRQVQHQSGSTTLPAAFYMTWAQLEAGDQAEEILREGLRRKAEPILDLVQALQQRTQQIVPAAKRYKGPEDRTVESSAPSQGEGEDSNMSLDDDESEGGSLPTSPVPSPVNTNTKKDSLRFQLQAPMVHSTPLADLRKCSSSELIVQRSSIPHVLKVNESVVSETSPLTVPPTSDLFEAKKTDAPSSALRPEGMSTPSHSSWMPIPPFVPSRATNKAMETPEHQTIVPPTNLPDATKDAALSATPKEGNPQTTASSTRLPLSSRLRGSVIPPLHPPSSKILPRQPLASKRPPLKPFGLLGKAERVDPSQSILEMDSEYDEVTQEDHHRPSANATPSQPSKISKMDLEYMWNWDPEKKRRPEPTTTDPLGGGTPSLSSSSCSNGSNGGEKSSGTPSEDRAEERITNPTGLPLESSVTKDHVPSTDRPVGDGSTERNKINADFLPLIYERNIIRVNNEPYVKLGVIGKGGSCKVYRVLSTDGSVWALKRVKLQNLDRKAMDGYANEIALLNRLRGNPSIIQLQDSQVDLTRQMILLVMEAGEADLNHILQRQSLQHQGSQSSTLNMNFIRLTWQVCLLNCCLRLRCSLLTLSSHFHLSQQMLKAVHSIHEQRIIHGDLKPANFLFVRGTLKLIDFGIAKAIQNDNTTHIYRESQIGTLNYMSPEAICDSGTSSLGQRMKCGRVSREVDQCLCEFPFR
jgi:Protein kinase domain